MTGRQMHKAGFRRFGMLLIGSFVVLLPFETPLKAQSVRRSESPQRVVFDGAAFSWGLALPQWSNGYLVVQQIETAQAGIPNVWLYEASGNKARQAVIWFPGSQRVLVYSAIATREGKIIAAGKAEKVNGEAVTFIAMTDLAGNVTDVIETIDFAPVNICQAPDGTVWSFGGTGYGGQSRPNPGDTLRNFDFRKGQLTSYLPRSAFPQKLHPGPEITAYIRCSAHEVVAYSPSGRKYIDLKYGSSSPRVYQVETTPLNVRLTGFAAIDSKRIYGHFSHGNNSGLYALSFDEPGKSVSWRAVEGTVGPDSAPGVITRLFGADADQLLVSYADDQAGEMAIYWTTPLRQ